MRLLPAVLLLALLAPLAAPAQEGPAKFVFGALPTPAEGEPEVFGSYAKGCLLGAIELPETGPTWQAMRLSRNRNWGHPMLIGFIARLGDAAVRAGWAGIYVGDLSQPRGGPMVSGHASHQIGLDADIWFRPARRLDLTRTERESISSINVRTADQTGVTADWTEAHAAILRFAAEDPDVSRIFVTAPAKLKLCAETPPGDRAWLRKVRPWWGHNDHFHIRLNCPAGSPGCVEQDPIPAGDGCDESLAWWISDEALHPKPKPGPAPPPKPPLTLADLPPECRDVATAP